LAIMYRGSAMHVLKTRRLRTLHSQDAMHVF